MEDADEERRRVDREELRHFADGTPMPARLAHFLRRIDPYGHRWSRPAAVDVDGSLLGWLCEADDASPLPLPRLAFLLWEDREDLRHAFADPRGADAVPFADWLCRWGAAEEGIAEPFLAPLGAHLDEERTRRIGAQLVAEAPPGSWQTAGLDLRPGDREWLLADVPPEQPGGPTSPPLPRLALLLREHRPDVARAFPDPLGASRFELAWWYVVDGRIEHDLDRELVEPVLAALTRRWRLKAALGVVWRRLLDRVRRARRRASPPPADPLPLRAILPRVGGRDWQRLLKKVDGAGRRLAPLNVFAHALWLSSPTLQSEIPLGTERNRGRFTTYLEALNRRKFQVQSWLLPRRGPRLPPAVPRAAGRFDRGVNLVEHPAASFGIREDTRLNRLALDAAGVPCSLFRIFNAEWDPARADEVFRHRVSLLHVNADQMLLAFGQLGPQLWEGRYTIAYWLWELARFPDAWHPSFDFVDEIWVPSRYVQDTLARVSPVPVLHLPYPVEATPASPALERADFGLPKATFLFLTSYDHRSFAARKNPGAAVEAFRRAFAEGDERVGLVVKVAHADPEDPGWRALQERAAADPRLWLIDEELERPRRMSLIQLCDAYVSLHRAEGFGRGPAEAMLLAKPVVVTDYSGTADFCTAQTACLVKAEMVPVAEGEYPFFEDQVWADPDVDHAASQLRRLVDDAPLRRRLATAGQRLVADRYSFAAAGQRYAERLRGLGLL